MQLFVALVVWALRASRRSVPDLVLENLALRQQLAACARAGKRPSLKPSERSFWVALSKTWTRGRLPLLIVQPATVIAWHRRAFRAYWRWRSGRGATAEEIVQQYPSLQLPAVYAVISYVLVDRKAVDEYVTSRQDVTAAVRAQVEAPCAPGGIRERLLARRGPAGER